ncbi:MAG: sigma-54-dependent Fis family transcriptional regulator [Candidatus Schekmanbacteria bacterium]|nr:sigma-54-dependent Fis family transcriptional regulator [Candidatus Schekmanbacteria bacterium]
MSSAKRHVLVADDEANMRRVLEAILRREGYEVTPAADGLEAIEMLRSRPFEVVVTDLRMPRAGGMEVFDACRALNRNLPVIIITAHGTVEAAVEAMKKGAFDFITKPFEADAIRLALEKAIRSYHAARQEVHLEDSGNRYRIIGDSAPMREIYDVIDRVADSPSTVLITGETGTGKELVAEAIHRLSSRRERPFVPINCAAIPETLLESELFGHMRGAFTGAITDKPGRFELADGGTLFLDEIGEVPKEIQVKLLRCLQNQEFERVGGVKTVRVDVRLVCATNKELADEVELGNFRKDLYYRLNVVPIRLPPLRDRRPDIPLLLDYFLGKYRERLGKGVSRVSEAAIDILMAYDWPGNIRELENLVERAMLLCRSDTIDVDELRGLADEWRRDSRLIGAPAGAAADDEVGGEVDESTLKDAIRRQTRWVERQWIDRALAETGGNVTQAARKLGISRKSLQMKMKEYGLRKDD